MWPPLHSTPKQAAITALWWPGTTRTATTALVSATRASDFAIATACSNPASHTAESCPLTKDDCGQSRASREKYLHYMAFMPPTLRLCTGEILGVRAGGSLWPTGNPEEIPGHHHPGGDPVLNFFLRCGGGHTHTPHTLKEPVSTSECWGDTTASQFTTQPPVHVAGPPPCFSEPPTHSLLWVFGEPVKEPGSLGFLLLQAVLVGLDLWGCGNASLEPRNSVSSSALYHPVQGASQETFIPHNTLPAHQLQQGAVGRKVRNLTLWTPPPGGVIWSSASCRTAVRENSGHLR